MHAGILKNAKRMSQVTLAFWGISKLHAGILKRYLKIFLHLDFICAAMFYFVKLCFFFFMIIDL